MGNLFENRPPQPPKAPLQRELAQFLHDQVTFRVCLILMRLMYYMVDFSQKGIAKIGKGREGT